MVAWTTCGPALIFNWTRDRIVLENRCEWAKMSLMWGNSKKVTNTFVCCRNEKMMSTMYLGELTRLCLVTCIKGNVVLNGVLKDKLNTSWAFQTEHMSRIESWACHYSNYCIIFMVSSVLEISAQWLGRLCAIFSNFKITKESVRIFLPFFQREEFPRQFNRMY